MVTCSKNGKSTCRTEEFDDSPSGSGTTTCKQIFSIRKLLAIDEDGVISVDSFPLPSACLCRFLPVRLFHYKLIFSLPSVTVLSRSYVFGNKEFELI